MHPIALDLKHIGILALCMYMWQVNEQDLFMTILDLYDLSDVFLLNWLKKTDKQFLNRFSIKFIIPQFAAYDI